MERAPPPAPTGLANYQDMMRMVFTSMAGRRLLPKEGWGLNRAIRDTAAPTVSVHVKRAPLKADSTSCTILHGLLEDSARRLVVKLTMEGDFTSVQERPLSLPPSLVSLYLNGFRGLRELDLVAFPQLDELPPGLRFLKLRNHDHPLPPLPDTLETLVLDNCTHHVANIPDSVRSLSLYWLPPNPAPPLPTRWPAHLERLMYWAKSDGAPMPVIKRLPPTLRELALNGCEVHASLPRTLQKVRLGRNFTQQLTFTGRVTVNSNDNWYF
ncbi:hypothetical protein JKP88DRAFT_349274 [Tribonema minus]|uniref:Uncharacterized protein n=1 Tax=Tribonema minus TaxID=303371 RepID=A0A835YUX2_9STRA|nr:hypothetical protein JKP88DRAFT_349274 [Tribonema minus]